MRASPTAATMVTPPRCAAFTRATQGSGSPLMFASARPSMAKAASSSPIPTRRPRLLRPSSNGRTNPRSSSRRPADVVIQQELVLLPERWFGDPAPDRPDLAADTLTSSANQAGPPLSAAASPRRAEPARLVLPPRSPSAAPGRDPSDYRSAPRHTPPYSVPVSQNPYSGRLLSCPAPPPRSRASAG